MCKINCCLKFTVNKMNVKTNVEKLQLGVREDDDETPRCGPSALHECGALRPDDVVAWLRACFLLSFERHAKKAFYKILQDLAGRALTGFFAEKTDGMVASRAVEDLRDDEELVLGGALDAGQGLRMVICGTIRKFVVKNVIVEAYSLHC